MYQIKQIPEDFIVKEISNLKTKEQGDYSYILLKKTNYTTIRAIQHIAEKLNIKLKNIGFAGNKDKNGVTEQNISIKNVNPNNLKNLNLRDIELTFLGKSNDPISLGDLIGNKFIITIRNLDQKDMDRLDKRLRSNSIKIPNYFGEQRFSKNNALIGKKIIKKEFKSAIELILESEGDYEEKIKKHMENKKTDYIGALRLVPLKILKMFVHSCQSQIFNEIVKDYIKSNKEEVKIPLIGFGTEIDNCKNKKLKEIVTKTIKKEKINLRDFIIRQIPELSSEGDERNLFIDLNDLKLLETTNDELNKDKKKIRVSFSLKKGCYATVVIRSLLN